MSTSKNNVEEKEESLFGSIMFRFVPYWPLFLILLIVCSAGAWAYVRFSMPMYNASAKILLKDQKKGVDDSKMLESLDIYTSNKIVENEIEVIRSRALMREVVEKLHLYAPIYEKGDVADHNAYATSPILIESKDPENIKGTDPVFFTYDAEKKLVKIENQTYPVNTWVTTPFGDLRFNQNDNIKDGSFSRPMYFSLRNPRGVARGLVGRLAIKPISKASTVLELSFQDESPKRAEDILNTLIESYSKSAINEKNALATNTLAFIDERLKYVVKDLETIEQKIQRYKSQRGIVNLSTQSEVFLKNVGDNDRKAGDISMQLAVLDQVESYVVSKNNRAGIVPATLGLNDEVLTKLLQRLYDAEVQYSKLKETMAENSPSLLAIASEIENVRPAVLENVRNQRASLQASRSNIAATNGAYTSMLSTIPQKERELLEISREQTIKNSVYSFLLQKREETALSSSSTVGDSRLIDAAESNYYPVGPKTSLIYFGALIIAFVLGIGIVSAKELMTTKILFRSDIEKFTKVPIAAEVTSVKHKAELVVNNPDNVVVAEQFRQLRASIGLYGRSASRKKILITSSIAGEGKSFVAANLALSLALSGKKVVLLDVDLRSPKTSSIFGLEDTKGIAEYLEGHLKMEELVHKTDTSNLYIIPAGEASKNPTEILINGKLNELFKVLESSFDYILVDTSPIDPVTDAYVLSEYCDRTLFVIRHDYTPKAMVQLLDENNKIKALNNLAIVFNGIKKRGFIKGNYGFGYGFGYEYVYKERGNLRSKKSNATLN